jgi:peptidoglycan/LPS O-acetylase OafA/YrhL
VVIAAQFGRGWWVGIVGVAATIAVGAAVGDDNLLYLPMFLLGTLIAARLPALSDFGSTHLSGRRKAVIAASILLVGVLLLEARWELNPLRPGGDALIAQAHLPAVFGAGLIVLVSVIWTPFAHFLELRIVQWLGRISFSLYLVHVPILIATAWFLRGIAWYWTPVVAIPIALLVATLFTRFIERPSHRLSQWIGRTVARRLPPAAAPRGASSAE